MTQNEIIAKRLSELRKEKGIKQEEVAKLLNVKRATVANYETGKRAPDYDTMIKLADYYGVSCDYILRGVKSEFSEINSITGLMQEAINELAIEKKMVELSNDTFPYHLDILNKFIQSGVIVEIALQITKIKECLKQKKGLYDMAIKSYKEPHIDCEIFDDKGFDGRLDEIQDKIDLSFFKLQRLMTGFTESYCRQYVEEVETSRNELNKCEIGFLENAGYFSEM